MVVPRIMTGVRIVNANGVELCTESFGDPYQPAILLIMGAAASMLWWPDELCRRVAAAGRHVIRYDQRDTGWSTSYPPGQPGYSLDDLADDVIAILAAYGIERAHLVGMSLGGMLAQIIALKYPGRVSALTLIASSVFGPASSDYPDVVLDITADDSRIDIVAAGFDAGIHFGEYIQKDMIAVRVSKDHRAAIVASPSFFKSHPKPKTPHDLLKYRCINFRHGSAGVYRWEFDKGKKSLSVAVNGPLIVDDGGSHFGFPPVSVHVLIGQTTALLSGSPTRKQSTLTR
jgi:pimeloyl-ACP methyl ester carboxylesterase